MTDLTGTVYNESLETIWSIHLVYSHTPDRQVECNAKVHWVADEYGNELAWFEPPPEEFLETAQMTQDDVLTFITEEVLV